MATVSFSLTIGTTPSSSSRSRVRRALRVVRAAGDVVGGEQHLPDGEPVRRERRLVCRDQGALADAGRGLLGRQVARADGQAQRRDAGRDGAGGDEHDLAPGRAGARRARRRGRRARRGRGAPPSALVSERGADLDDEALPVAARSLPA